MSVCGYGQREGGTLLQTGQKKPSCFGSFALVCKFQPLSRGNSVECDGSDENVTSDFVYNPLLLFEHTLIILLGNDAISNYVTMNLTLFANIGKKKRTEECKVLFSIEVFWFVVARHLSMNHLSFVLKIP